MSSNDSGGVSSTRKLLSASALMAGGTLVSRALGILRTMLIVFILGNGTRQADMFSLANTIPNSLYILFAGGALNTVLVPQIVRAIRHDEDGGEAYTNRIMTAFMLVIAAVTLFMVVAAPAVMFVYSDDAWRVADLSAQYGSMIALAYCTMPQIFFYGAFVMLGQILNARDQFGPMMWAPIANNVVSIAVFGLYLGVWGTGGDHSGAFTTGQILLLGLGSTLGIVIQTLVLLPFLKKVGFKLRPRFDLRGVGLRKTFHLAKWTLGFVAVNQLVFILVSRLATSATATGAGGGTNVYDNAHLMWILPHSLITVSLATAMLPNASRLAAAQDYDGVAEEARKTMRLSLIALVPSAFAFLALAFPMAALVFGQGSGGQDADLVAWTLIGFAVGLIPFTIQFVCLRTFYALENTKTPFLLQCVIAAVNAVGALVLVFLVNNPSMVSASLALAYSIAYWVGVQVSWRQLKSRVPSLNGRDIVMHVLRLSIGSAIGAGLAWLLAQGIMNALTDSFFGPLLALVVGAGFIGVTYVAFGKLLKVRELTSLGDLIRRRLGRGDSAPASEKVEESSISPMVPTIGAQPATGAAAVDDLMPTGLHTIIADGGFNGWDLARLPEQQAPQAPVLPEIFRNQDAESTDDVLATRIRPANEFTPSPQDPRNEPSPEPSFAQLLAAGDLLSTRFRLEEPLVSRSGVETWRAHDLVLSRDVVAHVIPIGSPYLDTLLLAAQKGAVATDSRFLRILDAVRVEDPARGLGGYVVCEYAHGPSLTTLLQRGPLSAIEAAWVVRELADALAPLHTQGMFHEQLNPDNVVITNLGAVKLVGFGVEAGFYPQSSVRWSDRESADVRGLASLLYAMLVRHWPGQAGWGLPAAPIIAGETAPPHTVATGISPQLDRICSAALTERGAASDRRINTASQLAAALGSVLGTADASADLESRVRQSRSSSFAAAATATQVAFTPVSSAPAAPPATEQTAVTPTVEKTAVTPATKPRRPSRHDDDLAPTRKPYAGRPLLWTVTIAALGTLVISLVLVAINGAGSPAPASPQASSGATSQATGSANAGGTPQIVSVTSFDPQADNGSGDENPEDTAKTIDGDSTTGWPTMRYLGNPAMGGEKPGVGLVIDLGQSSTVNAVEVSFERAGTTVELRVPQTETEQAPMKSQSEWRTVATTEAGTQATLSPEQPLTTRYLLIYVTKLPEVEENRYQSTITEIAVR